MSKYIFPKLADSNQFEYMLIDLFQAMYPNTQVEKYGRQGQKQYGIDITIQGDINNKPTFWCIQCKNYDKLTVKNLDEILKECTFYDKVQQFEKLIIATFAPNDAKIVDRLLEIRYSKKYPFEIEYVPHDKICDYIEENPAVCKKYYGDLFSQDLMKTNCLSILLDYKIEAFLRENPLISGMPNYLPDHIEECCYKLQELLDNNLNRKGDSIYNLIAKLHDCLDQYNSSLSFMLFPEPNSELNENFRFVYLPPEAGPDLQYREKTETVYNYIQHLTKLINDIATT